MLDKLRELIISKDGIYYIVIPLITFIVPLVRNYLSKQKETFSYIHKEKSSYEKFFEYQFIVMIVTYIFVHLAVIICTGLGLYKYSADNYKNVFRFICCTVYIVIIMIFKLDETEKKLNIKTNHKTEKCKLNNVIFYGLIIYQGIILFLSTSNNKFLSVIGIMLFSLIIIILSIILDTETYYKYKYVYLTFENGIETEAILCENIKKDGNWLIVYSEQKGEIHYRLKDIKSFRYTNRSYIKI